MGAVLTLVTLHAALIAVRAPDAQCPSARQLSEAITNRLPGVVVPLSAAPPDALQLRLDGAATSDHHLVLANGAGKVLLGRTLPPVPGGRERDCEALAETVALIVDRYLQELSYQEPVVTAPPPLPAPEAPRHPRWELFAGGVWQPPFDASSRAGYEGRVGVGRTLGRSARLIVEAAVGLQGTPEQPWNDGDGTSRLWRLPAELRLLWRSSLAPLRLELGPFAGFELLSWSSENRDGAAEGRYVTPVGGAEVALRLPMGERAFLRLVGAAGYAVKRYSFVQMPGVERFGTEHAYGKMGLESGLVFW